MLGLWFQDNEYYFSKESFFWMIEANEYEFYEDGSLA